MNKEVLICRNLFNEKFWQICQIWYNEEEIEIIYFKKAPFVWVWKQKTGPWKDYQGHLKKSLNAGIASLAPLAHELGP